MKELLIFILLIGCGVTFYHDRQQTELLKESQDTNTQLQEQLTTVQGDYSALLQKNARQAGFNSAPPAGPAPHQGIDSEPNPLDLKPYKN